MIARISLVLNLLAAFFKSKSRLEAENAALRLQLIVLQRKVRGRIQLDNGDRLFFVQLYRWVSWLLALEVSVPGRSAADQHGTAGIDPADEP